TLTGGKWTTFRRMGEDTLNSYYKLKGINPVQSKSAAIKFYGFTLKIPEGHLKVYGKDAEKIDLLLHEHPGLSSKLHPDYPYTEGEVRWAVREEMAVKIEDVLSRRIRLLISDASAALHAAPRVAELMAEELGKDSAWIQKELTDFNKMAKKYLINLQTHASK